MSNNQLRHLTPPSTARLGALPLALGLVLAAAGCDDKSDTAESGEGRGAAAQTDPDGTVTEKTTAAPDAEPVERESAEPAAALDACLLVTADEVKSVLGIDGELSASKDHLNLMGTFDTACGYKHGDKLRVSFTVAPDAEGKDFRKLEAAKAAGVVTDEDDVAGKKAVRRGDGSLIWHGGDGRLYTINVFEADTAAPLEDKAPSRKLAELAIPRAAGG